MALQIDSIGGPCPVQAEGMVDGVPFYFRARYAEWQMAIGHDAVGIACGDPGWMREGEWGDGPHDAGYMPLEVARELIDQCVDAWRNERSGGDE